MTGLPLLRTLLLASLVCVAPNLAHALTISAEPGATCFSTDPKECIGGEYTVTVAQVDDDTWIATYTMDLALGLEIPATTVEQIEFNVAKDYSNVVVSTFTGPGGVGNWLPLAGPLAAEGCKGNNGGFVCLDATNPVAIPAGSYTWTIQFDATRLLAESEWHIGARFASPDHQDGWILSASAPIPEPRSTALFLIGGALVAAVIRKQVLTTR